MQEFHPYVFQILAQLIELSDPPLGPVSCAACLRKPSLHVVGLSGHCSRCTTHLCCNSLPHRCTPTCRQLCLAAALLQQTAGSRSLWRSTGGQLKLRVLSCSICRCLCRLFLPSQVYMMMFPPLLNPMFWERPGNTPALTRLLVSYLSKAGQEIVSGGGALLLCGDCFDRQAVHCLLWSTCQQLGGRHAVLGVGASTV